MNTDQTAKLVEDVHKILTRTAVIEEKLSVNGKVIEALFDKLDSERTERLTNQALTSDFISQLNGGFKTARWVGAGFVGVMTLIILPCVGWIFHSMVKMQNDDAGQVVALAHLNSRLETAEVMPEGWEALQKQVSELTEAVEALTRAAAAKTPKINITTPQPKVTIQQMPAPAAPTTKEHKGFFGRGKP